MSSREASLRAGLPCDRAVQSLSFDDESVSGPYKMGAAIVLLQARVSAVSLCAEQCVES